MSPRLRAVSCADSMPSKSGSDGASRDRCGSVSGRSASGSPISRLPPRGARTGSRSPDQRDAAALLAGVLRTAFLAAGALRATADFLAGALRTAFLAAWAGGADLPAEATAVAMIGNAPFLSLGAVDGASTASLKAFTGVMRAFLEALMRMVSPVAGLRPMRAARSTLTNLAKPGIEIGSPLDTTAVTTSVNPSRTAVTVFSSTSDCTATDFARSLLFMVHIVHERPVAVHIERPETFTKARISPRRDCRPGAGNEPDGCRRLPQIEVQTLPVGAMANLGRSPSDRPAWAWIEVNTAVWCTAHSHVWPVSTPDPPTGSEPTTDPPRDADREQVHAAVGAV